MITETLEFCTKLIGERQQLASRAAWAPLLAHPSVRIPYFRTG
jgi:hypothetical protein